VNFAEGGRVGEAQLPRETKSVEVLSCGYSLNFVQRKVLETWMGDYLHDVKMENQNNSKNSWPDFSV
jgi:hypothetical protein